MNLKFKTGTKMSTQQGQFILKKDDVMVIYDDSNQSMWFAGKRSFEVQKKVGLPNVEEGNFPPNQYLSIKKKLLEESERQNN
jgi:hypothetical protein